MAATSRAWLRRPSLAVARLRGRPLLVLSARDLLAAAAEEDLLLVALVAPAPAAIAGFVRAARDAEAPLVLVRPSGASGEKGPHEARDDVAFTDTTFRIAAEMAFHGPLVLLKEPPRTAAAGPETDRVQREVEAGFTGVALAAADTQQDARDAALTAAAICQMELGLEVVPLGGARAAAELARQLRSRGAPPSAVRITGVEDDSETLSAELDGTALSTSTEAAALAGRHQGLRQLVAAGPFLRALRRTVDSATWDKLQSWADENGATPEQSAAHHQRLLRDLPAPVAARLEALCCFEALDLFKKAAAHRSSARLIAAVAALHAGDE
jgi:hypothetical protein